MISKDREGNILDSNEGQDKFLEKLYTTPFGRSCVKVMIKPSVSKAGGWLLKKRISRLAIKPFILKNDIDMSEYESKKYKSYNDFFSRRVKPANRPVDIETDHFISPCDSKLTVYKINEDSRFKIKGTEYTVESLTRSGKLSRKYNNGVLFLFRLTVDDYHRFCYIDDGEKSCNYKINGVFHTVNPIANDQYPIYKENTREFTFLKSKNFGTMMIMEVGALMVGKIVNFHGERVVTRGMEKGKFEFGGSTIIVCVKENKVKIDEDILKNSLNGIETKVKYGEKIGEKF